MSDDIDKMTDSACQILYEAGVRPDRDRIHQMISERLIEQAVTSHASASVMEAYERGREDAACHRRHFPSLRRK